MRVWLRDDWSLGAADGTWQIRAAAQGLLLPWQLYDDSRLILAPVLNGDGGPESEVGLIPADASYYYSMPRLQVHRTTGARWQRLSQVAGQRLARP